MKKVRIDVINKLMDGLKAKQEKDPNCMYFQFDTPRSQHFIRLMDGIYYCNTIQYDGSRCHSEIKEV